MKEVSNVSVFKDGAIGIPLGANDLVEGMKILVNGPAGYIRMEARYDKYDSPVGESEHNIAALEWDTELEQWICQSIVNKRALRAWGWA